MTKEQILKLIEDRGFTTILKDHDLTLWKVLEILDDFAWYLFDNDFIGTTKLYARE